MHWGWKITAVYITFVIGILTLVFKASSERVDLVSKDYYAQELAYSKRLEAQRNISLLSSPPVVKIDATTLHLSLPYECAQAYNCSIHLYCPYNAANDRQFEFPAAEEIAIPFGDIVKGIYVVKLSFTIGDKDYYYEQAIEQP
jgi:hypothetical protein